MDRVAAGGRRIPDADAERGTCRSAHLRGLRRARDAQRGRDPRGAVAHLPRLGPRHAEWQAALRTDPARLVTVRVEDGPLAGAPAHPPCGRPREPDRPPRRDGRAAGPAGRGRRRPRRTPRAARRRPVGSAACGATARRRGPPRADRPSAVPARRAPDHRRRRAAARARAPASGAASSTPASRSPPRDLQARIWADLTQLADDGGPAPDLLVVTRRPHRVGQPRRVRTRR